MRFFIVLVLISFLLMMCAGCAANFPDSEGGIVDYITGNSLKRDKAQWDADTRNTQIRLTAANDAKALDVQLAAERTRREEATLAGLRVNLTIAQEQTEQLRLEKAISDAEAKLLEAQVALQLAEGQVKIDTAVAGALTRSSRMHAVLEVVLAIFALFGIGVAFGVLYTFLRTKMRGY